MRIVIGMLAAATLAGCAGRVPPGAKPVAPVSVQIIAFNDFHGNLEAGKLAVDVPGESGVTRVPAGGAAYFASAVAKLREGHPNSVTVSAGDMISASPLVSSMFLDEPTIHAMNLVGVDFNAVGNHEFDRGQKELLRLQNGGCAKNTKRQPCAVEPFTGAKFGYLAANVAKRGGGTLFPSYGIRSFGKGARQVRVAFIGMTLKGTSTLVMASGVAGLKFEDEADTVNALVPKLKAEGADAIVVLIHQGGYSKRAFDANSCEGMTGDIFPILERLDPRVDLVVSGHTHNAYICDYGSKDPTRPLLLTSAGYGGTLLTDITLDVDPVAGRVVAKRAANVLVQGEPFTSARGPVAISDRYARFAPEPRVAALVARYAAAAKSYAERPIGKLTAPAPRSDEDMREQVLGNLIADAQLAATAAQGAQIALMNAGSVRASLTPRADGTITFGDLYAAQPFGNVLVIKQFTGRQLRAVLEQQFDENKAGGRNLLLVSRGFGFGYDLGKPVGQRVVDPKLNGAPLVDEQVYRVVMSNFLGNGGDGFSMLIGGNEMPTDTGDLDALEAYFAGGPVTPPATDRTRDVTLRN
ncbi:bifunctional metallophosphatase/5'-nucleotidase [Sphingomonas sp. DG1-23]|uniref:bifunctional metallophosphatase/5'-nucleotidase n=1 Tax=Sphingomonas sp. DG1-23 TaxID=3068316 RepID=UPI00273EE960|nr:bifunctional metallophosphatase/5'-nucleotidase [Sphingomonas sp. DG1-23]MDP5277744.1 bifunctional metallophosphatase/5'-nucleotidase [Sphingomonas sp. DG1-23]